MKIRWLLGIEEGDDEIALKWRADKGLCDCQVKRDGGGIIICTWCINHAVVMGSDEKRWQRAVASWDHPDKVAEVEAGLAGGIGFAKLHGKFLAKDLVNIVVSDGCGGKCESLRRCDLILTIWEQEAVACKWV